MTNKEAIERLKWVEKRISDITYSPESFEALEIAIKALEERPQGEWVEKEETPASVSYYCSNCECAGLGVENFCSWCGADMRGGVEHGSNDR